MRKIAYLKKKKKMEMEKEGANVNRRKTNGIRDKGGNNIKNNITESNEISIEIFKCEVEVLVSCICLLLKII